MTIVLANLRQEQEGSNQSQKAKDEIKDFVDGRFIAPSETVRRTLGFMMHSTYVIRLRLHLPGQLMHAFREDDPLEDVLVRALQEQSKLIAFFIYYEENPDPPQINTRCSLGTMYMIPARRLGVQGNREQGKAEALRVLKDHNK